MSPPVLNRICHYAGLVTIPFRTYTTTYPFIHSGWKFSNSNYEPCEFWQWGMGGLSGYPIALTAQYITLNEGYTAITIGNKSGGTAIFDGGYFDGKQIYGFAFYTSLNNPFYAYSYGMKLGTNLSMPLLEFGNKITIPGTSNTQAPQPFFGTNFSVTNDRIWTSAASNNVPRSYLLYKDGQTVTVGAPAPDFGLSSFLSANCGMYANGVNYISLGSGPNPSNTIRLMETDYLSFATQYSVTFESPPGGANIDNLIAQNIGNTSRSGWLNIFKNTITVEGQTLKGFAIITRPDCSSYVLAKLLPLDATAAAWTSAIGAYDIKMDSGGALWFKSVNSDTTLFVSAGSVIKQLPIFPPIPIPDHGDSDPSLLLMRGKGTS